MSVNERTVCAWERDQEPAVSHYPVIVAFLGREPWKEPQNLPERLLAARRRRGLTIEAASALIGVEASTWWWWECGRKVHRLVDRDRLGIFIKEGAPASPLPPTPGSAAVPSLGQLLRDRRKTLGLTQKAAARELYVNEFTLINWELNRRSPADRYYPAIIRYLGQEPWPEPASLGERIRAQRLRRGYAIAQLASVLGVDETSLAEWERGRGPVHRLAKRKIAAFVDGMPVVRSRRPRKSGFRH